MRYQTLYVVFMEITLLDWLNYQPKPQSLNNKVILVTGAADGIGRAVSLSLAKHGATVILLDKKTRHLEKLYDQMVELNCPEPVLLPFDLMASSPESCQVIFEGIEKDFGRLDGLLHNAAELGSPAPLEQYDAEYWQKVMLTNLQAPFFLTQALLPLLREASSAQLLFSSDVSGRNPKAFYGAYGVAYGGLEAQMRIWAEELENASNIKVNSIDPGPIRTSLRRRSHPGESQDSLIAPQTITPAYLKLLSGDHDLHGEAICIQDNSEYSTDEFEFEKLKH